VNARTSRLDLAVERSLDPARARAEKRVERFLDAATELMSASPDREFTVAEVVERSGQSLRSFYQYFAGKHELLLALFEGAVRTTADGLTTTVDGVEDPIERLRTFTEEYYRLCRPSSKQRKTHGSNVFAEFAQRLLTEHPAEAAKAFAPLVVMLRGLLDDAAAAGAIRSGLDHQQIAGVVLQAVMFNAFADTISASSLDADAAAAGLWDLLLHGLTST